MKQSSFRYLGLFEVALSAVLVAVFGVKFPIASVAVLMVVAGICAILAGTVSTLDFGPITISWRHLIGVSYVTFALAWPLTYLTEVIAGTASQRELLLFAVAVIGALSLAFFGIDIARGGRHFSVTPTNERTLER